MVEAGTMGHISARGCRRGMIGTGTLHMVSTEETDKAKLAH